MFELKSKSAKISNIVILLSTAYLMFILILHLKYCLSNINMDMQHKDVK